MASSQSEENQHLLGLARRRAFETYLRYGRMPDQIVSAAESKALDPAASRPSALPQRPTRFYVWRSANDDRVRHSHAARHGKIFGWSEPPAGGHPGTEPNCRCWPEPYYGDPSVPDALQPLAHYHQVSSDITTEWSSIETLTRPDGSLSQSFAVSRDGTQIRSQFAGTMIRRDIWLPNGKAVRIDSDSGTQSAYLGNDQRLWFQTTWAATGPKVLRARRSVAFLGDAETLIDPDIDPLGSIRNPVDPTFDPNPIGNLIGPADGLGIIGAGLLALYLMQQAAPASQGLGEKDEPVAVVKTWSLDLANTTPVLVDAQANERFRQNCKHRDIIELWAIEAMARAASYQDVVSPQNFGIRAHKLLKDKVNAMSQQFPELYGNLVAEISYVDNNEGSVPYGTKGSSRLDVLEDRRSDMGAVCVYDMKTGIEGLTPARLRRIGGLVSRVFPGASVFYVTQLGPMMAKNRAR